MLTGRVLYFYTGLFEKGVEAEGGEYDHKGFNRIGITLHGKVNKVNDGYNNKGKYKYHYIVIFSISPPGRQSKSDKEKIPQPYCNSCSYHTAPGGGGSIESPKLP